ncbi:MAG: FAD-dependent thymidylate synthase [Gemmatimonadaceae bacterium]
MFHSAPKLTIISRPVFTEPEHLPVNWLGDSTDGEKLAEFAGRLCYMSQRNPANRQTRDYLENIKRQGHGSVLEHANYSVLAEGISRTLTHELVRHRAGWGYCLSGDTLIYSEHRQRGKRNGTKKRTIKSIYERTLTPHGRSRLALLRLRCLDEAAGTFTTGRIAAVSRSGTKSVFKVELEDSKGITCSRDHRFLSSDGWKSLADLVGGLSVSPKGLAVTGELGEIMVNGTPVLQREMEYARSIAGLRVPDPFLAPRPAASLVVMPKLVRIVKVTYAGEQETYDIEMAGENHNFVANGIVTHNSQLSQRYVDESEAHFVIPPAILEDEALEKAWKDQMATAQTAYVQLVEQLMERYSWVADKIHRRKMAREAARGVLPNSTETKIVMTGNARAWRTMLELRSSEGAELEIRRFAVAALRLMQTEAPGFFSDFEIYTADDRREAARISYHKV